MREAKYTEIGKTGTAEQFLQAADKAIHATRFRTNRDEFNALITGAMEAFRAGHPENIQTALQSPEAFKFRYGFAVNYYPFFALGIISALAKNSSNKREVIELALAKTPAPDKQRILNNALGASASYGEESYIAALLDAGADPNADAAEVAVHRGDILASAIVTNSPRVIKMLYEHGACFDDARPKVQESDWNRGGQACMDRLDLYEKTFVARPGIIEVKVDVLQQMQEQIRDLTEEVRDLKSRIPAPPASQPGSTTSPKLHRKAFYRYTGEET